MGIYIIAVGILMVVVACWLAWRNARLALAGGKARGTIVGVREVAQPGPTSRRMFELTKATPEHDKYTHYCPVIEFDTMDGETITYTLGPSAYNIWVISKKIDILYDPYHSERATINSFKGVWAGPLLLTAFGIGAVVLGLNIVWGNI